MVVAWGINQFCIVLIFAFSPLCGMILDTLAAIPIFKLRLKLKNMFANIASY